MFFRKLLAHVMACWPQRLALRLSQIERRGGEVRTGAPVREFRLHADGSVAAVVLRDGTEVSRLALARNCFGLTIFGHSRPLDRAVTSRVVSMQSLKVLMYPPWL